MTTVIAHGGYRDATVDRVLEQAHVAWEEFNRQFADLDACFLATLESGFECAAAATALAVADADGDADDPQAAFSAGIDRLLEVIAAFPELARLCLVESAALGSRGLQSRQQGLQRFVELAERQLTAGDDRDSGASLAAEMVAGGIHEVLQRKAGAGDLGEAPRLAAELRQLWGPVVQASARA